jgi:hypothetical protein
MILVITSASDATANYLLSILTEHGLAVLRLDTDKSLDAARFSFDGRTPILSIAEKSYRPSDFAHVWYRRPERLKKSDIDGNTPEGQFILEEWAECLEGLFALIDVRRWVNHPSCNVAASHKIEQLARAESLGLTIPETLVTQDADAVRHFFRRWDGQVIVKPLAGGYVERPQDQDDSIIYTNAVRSADMVDLGELPVCPTLFQRMIPKAADIRITMLDGESHAVQIQAVDQATGKQRCDIRRNNMNDVTYNTIELPSEIRGKLVPLLQSYSLRFAAIDMALTTDGKWVFFEINPNGQWAWLDQAGATQIWTSFMRAFSRREP